MCIMGYRPTKRPQKQKLLRPNLGPARLRVCRDPWQDRPPRQLLREALFRPLKQQILCWFCASAPALHPRCSSKLTIQFVPPQHPDQARINPPPLPPPNDHLHTLTPHLPLRLHLDPNARPRTPAKQHHRSPDRQAPERYWSPGDGKRRGGREGGEGEELCAEVGAAVEGATEGREGGESVDGGAEA